MSDITHLQEKIGYSFSDQSYLRTALTHKSASKNHYEKLEFLGDSILNFAVSHLLYTLYPDMNEGDLSISRSRIVNKCSLAKAGVFLDIDDYIRTSPHQQISTSIRADVLEAVIAACYLDGGIIQAQTLIAHLFSDILKSVDANTVKDAKSLLQEYAHREKYASPKYSILSTSGKDHERIFTVTCQVSSLKSTESCRTKRRAEMLAASNLLQQLAEV